MTTNPNFFSDGGTAYARHRPDYPPEIADRLAAVCAQRALALDVGCGTGQLSRLLGRHFGMVIACDPSAAQLTAAAASPAVVYHRASAEALPAQDSTVDLITAAQAAHWFDLDTFYAEVRRVARPSAIVALLTYGVPTLDGVAGDAFSSWYYGDGHQWWPAQRRFVETAYRDLPFPFDELAFEPTTVSRCWTAEDLQAYIGTWSAARRAREHGVDLVASVASVLHDAVAGARERFEVVWPISGRIGRVR